MRKNHILGLSALLLLTTSITAASAEGPLRERFREKIRERMIERMKDDVAKDAAATPKPDLSFAYGGDPLTTADFWTAKGGAKGKAPLIIFVHGGGWSRGDKNNATGHWKPEHYTGLGYGFASINYRLVPEATVEMEANDVAAAIRAFINRADSLGIDPHRIVLMGHSAGAHLVALVGTDDRFLSGFGLSSADLAGVIPIDGAAYDVAKQMTDGPKMMQQTYATAFGTDPARQRALSPTFQTAKPNAPQFLILHVQRPDGMAQSKALAAALTAAGTAVQINGFAGEGLKGHMEINRSLGDPAYAATPVVDGWLKRVFGG
ncbi:MAG: hypothetical protein RLY97_1653 [Pseudomonadota bacterium]